MKIHTDGTITLDMIEDWDYDSDTNTETINFNQDWYWWNGDQITAEDKYYFEQVQRRLNPDASGYEQLSVENNGQTIVRQHKEPQNPQLTKYGIGGYLGVVTSTDRGPRSSPTLRPVRSDRTSRNGWPKRCPSASTRSSRRDWVPARSR
jgi:hypothetical protein